MHQTGFGALGNKKFPGKLWLVNQQGNKAGINCTCFGKINHNSGPGHALLLSHHEST